MSQPAAWQADRTSEGETVKLNGSSSLTCRTQPGITSARTFEGWVRRAERADVLSRSRSAPRASEGGRLMDATVPFLIRQMDGAFFFQQWESGVRLFCDSCLDTKVTQFASFYSIPIFFWSIKAICVCSELELIRSLIKSDHLFVFRSEWPICPTIVICFFLYMHLMVTVARCPFQYTYISDLDKIKLCFVGFSMRHHEAWSSYSRKIRKSCPSKFTRIALALFPIVHFQCQ